MTKNTLKNEIIAWVEGGPYWFQHLSNEILAGRTPDNTTINEVYSYFLEDSKLANPIKERKEIVLSAKPLEGSESGDVKLQFIKDVQNVNALAAGQAIDIHPNLTIIYGANGTGKSGYVRILNRAFNSRGDKNILRNVFAADDPGNPSCTFTFLKDGSSYDLHYPTHHESMEFSKYSVFDTKSISVHLEGNNKLNFTPIGFEFFEHLLSSFEILKLQLERDIHLHQPENTFLRHFVNDNPIKKFIVDLGPESNKEELAALSTFGEVESKKLEGLIQKKEALSALNIATKISDLKTADTQLTHFIYAQRLLNNGLEPSTVQQYKQVIESYQTFRELSKQEGIKILESYAVQKIGSEEWKKFIKSSMIYAQIIKEGTDKKYPELNDNCLLCLQPLTEKENALISSYWTIVEGQAEIELNRLERTIEQIKISLERLKTVKFDNETILYKFIHEQDPALAQKWSEYTLQFTNIRDALLENVNLRIWKTDVVGLFVDIDDFKDITKFIVDKTEELSKKNPANEIEAVQADISFLNDKYLLSKIISSVQEYIDKHIWAKKATKVIPHLNSRHITIQQGKLFSTYITDSYTKLFNQECKILKAPHIVNIDQKNVKMTTLRSLQISGHNAGQVLSEGEQRAISLADFLTEIQLNQNNKGVIFDDPVTSLDHERRDLIAKRIASLSAEKQVIVFTHDIPFFIKLQFAADQLGIKYNSTTIRRVAGIPGIIKPEHPWIIQDVKKRVGFLKTELVHLKKIEKTGDSDRYEYEVKRFYGLLREAWERAVEERLFNGVIERFNIGVQTQKLRKVNITEEFKDYVEKGMTDCSSWVHDAATGLNPPIPDTDQAEKDLTFLEEFSKKCVIT